MVIILLLIIMAIIYTYNYYHNYIKTDSYKFKKEYEALNNMNTNDNKHKYRKINIPTTNNIVYADIDTIFDVLNNKTGIIYFGKPECPWCRDIISTLIKTAANNNVSKIYYYNPDKIRQENSTEYQELIKRLNQYLETDTTTQNKNDSNFDINKKRLYMPDVYFVKEGNIVGNHIGSVDSQKDPYISLSNTQKNELKKIYTNLINKMQTNACNDDGSLC